MHRAGWRPINGYRDDNFEAAEREYLAFIGQEPPVPSAAKFHFLGHWYMWEQARPLVRQALELHLPRKRRSQQAQWLERVLRADQLEDFAVERAREALMGIYQGLRAI